MAKFERRKKQTNKQKTLIKLMTVHKPCAHLHTRTKGPAKKIQTDRYEIVGGVAHTRYPQQCTLVVLMCQKMVKFKI